MELGKLTWRLYTTTKALLTINWIELIAKREFAKAALDDKSKIHVVPLEDETSIYLLWAAQIAPLQ